MGWTRGNDRENPGKYAYELWDGFETIARVGGFETAQECDRAAEAAQRAYLFPDPGEPLEDMSYDELLRELGIENRAAP